MKISYSNKKVEKQCTNLREAKIHFSEKVAKKLLKMINFIEAAENLQSIINFPPYRFHDLKGNKKGLYAMDIDGRRGLYRLIVTFEENDIENVFVESISIESIIIKEVSKHYE